MRIAGYLLAFTLLLLAVLPCCAFDDCPDDKQPSSATHQPGDEDCGNCSPFFSCAGCAAATVNYEPPQLTIASLSHPPVIFTPCHSPALREAICDIWQPPRTGC